MKSPISQSQNRKSAADKHCPVVETATGPRVLRTERGIYYSIKTRTDDYKVKISMPYAYIFDRSFDLLFALQDNNYRKLLDSVKKQCQKFNSPEMRPLRFTRPSQVLTPQFPDRSLNMKNVSGYPEDCSYYAEGHNNSYYELYHRPSDRDGNDLWRGTVSVTNSEGVLQYQQEIDSKPLSLGLLLRHCYDYEGRLQGKNRALDKGRSLG